MRNPGARRNGKRFQLTHITATLPTGMLGRSLANKTTGRYLLGFPLLHFVEQRINASKLACRIVLFGAGISKRPFARP
jgi:hypothetical protein